MEDSKMIIRADDVYRTYAAGQDPAALLKKTLAYMNSTTQELSDGEMQKRLATQEDIMIHAIFGSNNIENAGLSLEITTHLCHRVLRGEDVEEINENTPDCLERLLDIYQMDPSLRQHSNPLQHVLRGRQEIIQHLNAFQYLIDRFAAKKEAMTGDLIKETHNILCNGVSVIHRKGPETPSEEYAGRYRTGSEFVAAGNTNFVVPRHVPGKMAVLYADLERDMARAEIEGAIDPFSLASKYSLEFVQIHPFLDGNGRMCRLILNAILFRFAGIYVVIGETDSDKEEYLNIKKRSSVMMEGHGEYATFVLDKAMKSARKVKQKVHGKNGRDRD